MCGICGIFDLGNTGNPIQGSVIKAMTDVIVHRGPDDEGFYVDQQVALGMRRLSIIDLGTGHQPIHNEDKTIWVILNGEIYNFKELRSKLSKRGHKFYTNTDTEVLVHLYEEYGEEFVNHTRGMFGIALWDKRAEKFIIARDRMGVKPVYYAVSGQKLIFGSEIKSILQSGVIEPSVNRQALDLFLTLGYVPGPLTMFTHIMKLMPAELLVCRGGKVQIRKYWHLNVQQPSKPEPEKYYSEQLFHLLKESVRLRLVSDVPLGVMLSGGLDSSAIVALMAQMVSKPIKTFSIGFEGDEHSELEAARRIAQYFGTEHHELTLSFNEHKGIFKRLIWHMDEPISDLSAIGFYFISKLARENVKVALSGQGADELMAGYRKYVANKLALNYQLIPRPIREKLIIPLSRTIPRQTLLKKAAVALNETDLIERFIASSTVFTKDMKLAIYSGGLKDCLEPNQRYLRDLVYQHTLDAPANDSLATILLLDTKMALPDDLLAYFDKISMANSLEVRVPFMDHKLVEFCAAMPTKFKLKGFTTKHALREAMKGVLPAQTLKQKKVGFFAHTVDRWILEEKADIFNVILDPSAKSREYFDAGGVEKLLHAHMSGKTNHGRHILSLLLFELWHSTFLDKSAARMKQPGPSFFTHV